MPTLYASFVDAETAERAAGALLDHGARADDLSIMAGEGYRGRYSVDQTEALTAEATAKSGLTTTTAADAGMGAAKGTMAGLGVGILGALAALFVPGIGVVVAGSALATAVGAAAATAAAGAAVGGVAGFLKDQGVGEDLAMRYQGAIEQGGAVLAVNTPSGDMSSTDIEPYLVKYGALNVSTVNTARSLMEPAAAVIPGADPVIEPAMEVVPNPVMPAAGFVAPTVVSPEIVAPVPTGLTSMATVPTTPAAVAAAVNAADVRPTLIDPVTGMMREGMAVDPLTGVERPVRNVNGAIIWSDAVPIAAVEPVVASPVAVTPAQVPITSGFTLADVTPTEIDPVSGVVTRGTVVDPASGAVRSVRVMNGSIVYADMPA